MWQLNADDFLGTVPKGSHGHSKKAHEKKSAAGLAALEGIIEQDRWSSASSQTAAAHSVRAILKHICCPCSKKTSMH